MAYIFGSVWDRSNRNALNALSKSVEQQGKSIQDLVAEGQLTPEEYAQLLEIVNNMADKTVVDNKLYTKRDKDIAIRLADLHTDVKEAMTGGSVPVVGENAVGTENYKDGSVRRYKLSPDVSGYNNYRTEAAYNNKGLLERITVKDGTLTISRTTLTYDTDDLLTKVVEEADGKTITTDLIYHSDGRFSYSQNSLGGA